jgi:hypothetical protein
LASAAPHPATNRPLAAATVSPGWPPRGRPHSLASQLLLISGGSARSGALQSDLPHHLKLSSYSSPTCPPRDRTWSPASPS